MSQKDGKTLKPGECEQCGSTNNKGKFCGDCGAKIPFPKKKKSKGKSPKPAARTVKSPKSSKKTKLSPKGSKKKIPSSPRGRKSPSQAKGSTKLKTGKKGSRNNSRNNSPARNSSRKNSPESRKKQIVSKTVTTKKSTDCQKGNDGLVVCTTSSEVFVMTRGSDGLFVDSEFPPNTRSLYWKEHSVGEGSDRQEMDTYRWARAHTIFHEQEYNVFAGGIEPDDIAQGALGDCYYLSALAAIAEFPQRIKNVFLTKNINKDGRYVMKFCICGEFKEVVVDDYFPCFQKSDKPCFSRANGNELWVMLLEKGWAKINGCYENIIAGHTAEALRSVTGAPCVTLQHSVETADGDGSLSVEQMDDIWEQIEHGDRLDYIMCSSAGGDGDGCAGGVNDDSFESMGLISSHAYSLIAAFNVESEGKEVRLLQLRNPWGGTEWKGAWSDHCPKWTPKLKKQLDYKDEDDGAFWISYDDYLKYFENSVICKIDEKCSGAHVSVGHPPGECLFITFELKTQMDVMFLTASQLQKRMCPDESYMPACVQLIVGRMTGKSVESGDPIEFVNAAYGEAEDVTVDVHNAPPGQYIIYIEGDWKDQRQCYFNSYNRDDVSFAIVEDWFGGKFLEYILSSACKVKGNFQTYARSNQPEIKRCLSLSETKSGYGCMYYENNSDFCTLKERVEFTKFKGMTLMPPYSGNVYEVIVPPHTSKTVILKREAASAQSELSVKAKPAFIFPKEEGDVMKMVQAKGKKTAVVYNKKTYDIFWYSDAGKFVFVNETQDQECKVMFNFKFKDGNPVTWEFSLKPQDKIMKDLNAKSAYSYGYRFTVTKQIGSEEELHELIREKGAKGQVGQMELFYYYLYYGNDYVWLYDNKGSANKKLTCTFKLTNLALEGEPTGANSWTVELPSGATVLRKMVVVEAKPFTFSMSMSVAGM